MRRLLGWPGRCPARRQGGGCPGRRLRLRWWGKMLAHVDQQAVQREEVRCANGTPAFLAVPKAPGSYPVMVVLHERYGLGDYTRDMATRFASQGYVSIAPN